MAVSVYCNRAATSAFDIHPHCSVWHYVLGSDVPTRHQPAPFTMALLTRAATSHLMSARSSRD